MARHGGYKIIDFGGVVLNNSTAVKIPGIYDAIESTNKMIIASGLVVTVSNDTVELDDIPMTFVSSGGSFVGGSTGSATFKVSINSNDEVIMI